MKTISLYRPRDFSASVFGNAFNGFDRYFDTFFGGDISTHTPSVDIQETEKSYHLEAELPGFEEKDIEIRLDGRNLSIESKKHSEKNEEKTEGNYLIKERRSTSFSRSFKLPENADAEGIEASFKNGILSININKKAEAQAKLIQITK